VREAGLFRQRKGRPARGKRRFSGNRGTGFVCRAADDAAIAKVHVEARATLKREHHRVLFHVHTKASDGMLSCSDVIRCGCANDAEAIVILDHASLEGVRNARKLLGRARSIYRPALPLAYEHTIGETDLALVGVRRVLPATWDVWQTCRYVHAIGGAVVYLHPHRGSEPDRRQEIARLLGTGALDAIEVCNVRDGDHSWRVMDPDVEGVLGLDAHTQAELDASGWRCTLVSESGRLWRAFLAAGERTPDNPPEPDSAVNGNWISWDDFSVRIQRRVGSLTVEVRACKDWPRRGSGDEPWLDDCLEVALLDERRPGSLFTFGLDREGLLEGHESSLSKDGVSRAVRCSDVRGWVTNGRLFVELPWPVHVEPLRVAVSIRRYGDVPSQRRLIWPRPVWPPRTPQDFAEFRDA
jgi:hypothetical protein